MSDEKICPFMSRPIHYPGKKSFSSGVIHCQKEYCMAWGKKLEPRENIESPVIWIDGCRLIP